jgi:hypothetical protein
VALLLTMDNGKQTSTCECELAIEGEGEGKGGLGDRVRLNNGVDECGESNRTPTVHSLRESDTSAPDSTPAKSARLIYTVDRSNKSRSSRAQFTMLP